MTERTMATLASIQVSSSQPEPPRPEPERIRLTTYGQLVSHLVRQDKRVAALEAQLAELTAIVDALRKDNP